MVIQNQDTEENTYQWDKSSTKPFQLPGHLQGLPAKEGFSSKKILIFLFTAVKGILGLLIAQFLHLFPYLFQKLIKGELVFIGTVDLGLKAIFAEFNNWQNLKDFNSFFRPWTFFTKPKVSNYWDSDIEFGRQRLQGMNPVLIRKCQPEDIHLQGKFPVTEQIINPGENQQQINLQQALAENRLYILEYKIFDRIADAELQDQLGRYIQSPICLLYINDQQQLVPIAIKLEYNPSEQNYNRIFTPNSSAEDWLAAKITVSSADTAFQGIVSHLLQTHLIIEPFAVSTHRKLSPQHILYQLLTPHYFNTCAINNMARSTFLGRGGFFDNTGSLGYTASNELLNRGYNGYQEDYPQLQFYQLALPYNLAVRQVDALPGYYYRDDAILIWDAIKNYVGDVLKIHYISNADIINDRELQLWKEELIGFGNIQGLLPPDKENNLSSIDDLIDLATTIIFIATAQHSAVNFGQYDYAAWVPNNPFALYKPSDDLVADSSPNKAALVERLPNRLQSIKQIVLVKLLTLAPPISSDSLLTMQNPFIDYATQQAFERFRTCLQEIETKISTRNASLVQPYTYLLPSRIPQSIAI